MCTIYNTVCLIYSKLLKVSSNKSAYIYIQVIAAIGQVEVTLVYHRRKVLGWWPAVKENPQPIRNNCKMISDAC